MSKKTLTEKVKHLPQQLKNYNCFYYNKALNTVKLSSKIIEQNINSPKNGTNCIRPPTYKNNKNHSIKFSNTEQIILTTQSFDNGNQKTQLFPSFRIEKTEITKNNRN